MKLNPISRSLIDRVADRISPSRALEGTEKFRPRHLVIEALEPRVLFSGAPVAAPAEAPAPAAQPAPTVQSAPVAAAPAEAAPPEAAPEATVVAAPEANVEIPAAAPEEGDAAPANANPGDTVVILTSSEVSAIAQAAVQRWNASGLTAEQQAALANITYQIADLSGLGVNILAITSGYSIIIDDDAAGRGWFVDETPFDDAEFVLGASGPATTSIDLLSVLLHEQGHVLGLDGIEGSGDIANIMNGVFIEGERRLPVAGQAEGAIAGSLEGVHFARWNANATGNWNDDANWTLPATYPNAIDAEADLSKLDITANRTINVNEAIIIGSLLIGDSVGTSTYTLAVGTTGTLTFDVTSGNATITKTSGGTDTINAPITLNDTLVVTNNTSARVKFGGPVTGTGGITLDAGYLEIRSNSSTVTYTGPTIINNGSTLLYDFTNSPGDGLGPGNLTINAGILENYWADTLTRSLGTGNNQLQITGGTSGFSGQGSSGMTIKINNSNTYEVVWGAASEAGNTSATGYFNPSTFVLQASTANTNGKITFDNPLDLNGTTRTILVDNNNNAPGGFALMSRTIRDSRNNGAGLIKDGVGVLRLSAANTFTGGVTINNGFLRAENDGALGIGAPLSFAGSGATLDLRASPTIGALSGASNFGLITAGAAGARTLTVNQTTNSTFGGVIENGLGTVSLTKAGAGTLALSGANAYTGATAVNAGRLTIAAGNINATSGVTIAGGDFNYNSATALTKGVTFSGTGGTLSGTGTISNAVNITSGNTLAAGTDGIGTLTLSASPILAGTVAAQINKSGATLSADKINVAAALTYGGTLTVTASGDTLAAGDVFDLFDATGFSGSFTTVNLPTAPSGTEWDTSQLLVDGTIRLLSVSTGSLSAGLDGSNNLVITDTDGTGKNNQFTISNDGSGNIVITDAAEEFESTGGIAGASLSNGNRTLTVPLASIAGTRIIFNAALGNDTLTASLANSLGKILDFNGGPGGFDSLILSGGTTTSQTFNFTNENDGSVVLAGAVSGTINYTGLEPITSSITATNVTLNYSAASETITVTNAGGGQTTVDSTAGEIVTFNNPTGTLTINAGDGNDIINVVSLAANYPAVLVIDGQGGTDTVNLNNAVTLAANLTATSETINLGATITSGGDLTLNGAVSLGANATLSAANALINGGVALGANTLTTNVTGLTSTVTGVITGTGGLIKQGAGRLTFSNANSTYTGNLDVQGGFARASVNNIGGVDSAFGRANTARQIIVGTGATLEFAANDVFGNNPNAAPTVEIVVNGGTVTNTGNFFNTLGPITLNGGTLTAIAGANATFKAYQLFGTVTSTGNSTISSTGTDNGIHLYPNIAFNVTGGTLTVSATLLNRPTGSPAGGIIKQGAGQLFLGSAVSTFSGDLNIQGGSVRATAGHNNTNNTSALGLAIAARTITVGTGTTLEFAANDVFGNAGSAPTANIVVNGGTVTNTGNFFNTLGPITLNGGTLSAVGGANATFQTWRLFGAVTSTGTSSITSTGSNNGVHLHSSTTFNVTSGTLTVAAPLINQTGTQGSAAGAFVKAGAGTLAMTGAGGNNAYTGLTTVNAGTLDVGGSFGGDGAIQGDITINTGGTFRLTQSNIINNTSDLTVNTGGTFDMNGLTDVIGNLAGSGAIINNTNQTTGLILDDIGTTRTFSGTITGNGALNIRADIAQGGNQIFSGVGHVLSDLTVGRTTVTLDTGFSATVSQHVRVGTSGVVDGVTYTAGTATLNIQGNASLTTVNFFTGERPSGNAFTANINQSGTSFVSVTGNSGGGIGNATGSMRLSHWPSTTVNYLLSGGTLDVAGDLSVGWDGTGTFTQTGGTANVGRVVVNNSNSFNTTGSGTVTLDGGIMNIAGIGGLGFGTAGGPATVNLGGGTIRATGNWSSALAKTLTNATGPAVVDTNGFNVTLSGVLSGTGGLNKNGAGTVTLTAANTYTDATTISQGILQLGNAGTTGSLAASSTVTLGDANTGANDVAFLVNRSDVNTHANNIVVSALGSGTATIGSTGTAGGAFGTIFSGTVTLNRATTMQGTDPDRTTYTNVISGNVGTLTVTGGARTTWEANNTFVGNVVVTTSGTVLQVGGPAADQIPDASNVDLAAGTFLRLNNDGEAINALSGAGTVENIVGSNTLTIGSAGGGATFSGALNNGSGTLSLVKVGTGTQTLAGASNFTGNVNVNAGTLVIGNTTAFGTHNAAATKVNVASGATVDFNGIIDAVYGYTIAGTGVGGNGALVNNGAAIGTGFRQASNITLANNASIGGTGDWALLTTGYAATALDLAGFTLTKSGSNTFTLANATVTAGSLNIAGGTVTQISNNKPAGHDLSGVAVSLANTVGANLALNNLNLSVGSLAGGGTTGGNVGLGTGTLTVGVLGTSTSYAGTISGSGGFTKTGAGTQTLTNANTFTGITTVNAGAIDIQNANAIGSSSKLVLNAAGTPITGVAFNLQAAANAHTTGTDIDVNANVSLANNITIVGGTSNTRGLSIGGTGTLTYSGVVTPYNGAMGLKGSATLVLDPGASISLTGTVGNQIVFGTDGTSFIVNGGSFSSTGNNGANTGFFDTLTVNSGSFTASGAQGGQQHGINLAFPGASLNLNGGTTSIQSVIVGGTNASINFDGGTLRTLSSPTAVAAFIPLSANLTATVEDGGAIFDTNGIATVINQILIHDPSLGATPDGGLTKIGAGALILNAQNTFTGSTNVNVGTLAGTGGLTGALNIASGAVYSPGANPAANTTAQFETGSFSMAAGANFNFDLNGAAPGSGYDQTVVTGTVSLGNANFNFFSNGFNPAAFATFTLIDNDGTDPVLGTFLNLAEGAIIDDLNNFNVYTISYKGGDGNDVVLIAAGPAETGASIVGGNLVIEDIGNTSTNDRLTITSDGSNLIIRDPNQILGVDFAGASRPDLHTIVVPFTLFDNLIVRTYGGDDIINLGTLTGFGQSITVDGGTGFDLIQVASKISGNADESYSLSAERVNFQVGSSIAATGAGNIAVNGTGGGTGTGQFGFIYEGVKLKGAHLSTVDGNITVVGQGGADATANEGVELSSGSTIKATGAGSVSITGTGGTLGSSNAGVSLIEGSAVSSGAAGGVTILATGGGERDSHAVDILHGSTVSGGALGVSITGTSTGTGVRNDGVYVVGSTVTAAGGGSVTISGTGSQGAPGGGNAIGVRLSSNSVVGVSGAGGITLNGTGGSGSGSGNEGVHIGLGTSLATASGNIVIRGTGTGTGSANIGVNFLGGSSARSGGALTIAGTGGNGTYGNAGVSLVGTTLSSAGGNALSVTGTGRGSQYNNRGIVGSGATITGGGGGNVTLTGTGSQSSTGASNEGVGLTNTNASTAGTLKITGTGGTGTGANSGIRITGGSLSGTLDLDGFGGGGGAGNTNVGTYLTSVNLGGASAGSDIFGAGGLGSGGSNHGVIMQGILGGYLGAADGTAGAGAGSKAKVGNFFNFLPAFLAVAAAEERSRGKVLAGLMRRILVDSEGIPVYREEDGMVGLDPVVATAETLEGAGIYLPAAPEGTRAVVLLTGDDHEALAGFVAFVAADGELVSSEPMIAPADLTISSLLTFMAGERTQSWSTSERFVRTKSFGELVEWGV